MTVNFQYPYLVQEDTPAVAAEVQTNFDQLLAWIQANYVQKDDTPGFDVNIAAPLTSNLDNQVVSKAYVDGVLPTGTILSWAGTSLPDANAYEWCRGANVATTGKYGALFGVIGTTYGDPGGGQFTLPDFRENFPLGANPGTIEVGDTGGSTNVVAHAHTGSFAGDALAAHGHTSTFAGDALAAHDHSVDPPSTTSSSISQNHTHSFTTGNNSVGHTHTINHNHDSFNTSSGGAHTHDRLTSRQYDNLGDFGVGGVSVTSDSPIGSEVTVASNGSAHVHSIDVPNYTGSSGGISANHTHSGTTGNQSISHTHSVNIAAFDSGDKTAGTPSGTITVVTASGGTPSGTVTVDTDGDANDNRPPWQAINYIIKL